MVPVEAPDLRAELQSILDVQLADNRKAWALESDGSWRQEQPAEGEPERDSQAIFMANALRRRAR
jgi:polyphosphate kinase